VTTEDLIDLPNLSQLSELGLLELVAGILIMPGPISVEDRKKLNAINNEFIRRDSDV
jgi:hypothetical protein